MINKDIRILGVLVTKRENEAENVQKILSKYGCSIKTRLGLHEETEGACKSCGLIILELTGATSEMDKLEKELNSLDGLQVNKISFPL